MEHCGLLWACSQADAGPPSRCARPSGGAWRSSCRNWRHRAGRRMVHTPLAPNCNLRQSMLAGSHAPTLLVMRFCTKRCGSCQHRLQALQRRSGQRGAPRRHTSLSSPAGCMRHCPLTGLMQIWPSAGVTRLWWTHIPMAAWWAAQAACCTASSVCRSPSQGRSRVGCALQQAGARPGVSAHGGGGPLQLWPHATGTSSSRLRAIEGIRV